MRKREALLTLLPLALAAAACGGDTAAETSASVPAAFIAVDPARLAVYQELAARTCADGEGNRDCQPNPNYRVIVDGTGRYDARITVSYITAGNEPCTAELHFLNERYIGRTAVTPLCLEALPPPETELS